MNPRYGSAAEQPTAEADSLWFRQFPNPECEPVGDGQSGKQQWEGRVLRKEKNKSVVGGKQVENEEK